MSKENALKTLGTKPSFSSHSLNRSAMAEDSGAGLSLSAMTVEQHAGREEEQVAALLVASAGALLESQGTGAPKAFVDALFGQTMPEDVVRYDGREVAALAEAAWAFLAERKPGAPKIRLESPAEAGERLRSISVLEII